MSNTQVNVIMCPNFKSMTSTELKSQLELMINSINSYTPSKRILVTEVNKFMNILRIYKNNQSIVNLTIQLYLNCQKNNTNISTQVLGISTCYTGDVEKAMILHRVICIIKLYRKGPKYFSEIYGVHICDNKILIFMESSGWTFSRFKNDVDKLNLLFRRMASFITRSKLYIKHCNINNFIITDPFDCKIKLQLDFLINRNYDDISELGKFVTSTIIEKPIHFISEKFNMTEEGFVNYCVSLKKANFANLFRFAYRCVHHDNNNNALQIFIDTNESLLEKREPITNNDNNNQSVLGKRESSNDNNNNNDNSSNNNNNKKFKIALPPKSIKLAEQVKYNLQQKFVGTMYFHIDKRLGDKICMWLSKVEELLRQNSNNKFTNKHLEADIIVFCVNNTFPIGFSVSPKKECVIITLMFDGNTKNLPERYRNNIIDLADLI